MSTTTTAEATGTPDHRNGTAEAASAERVISFSGEKREGREIYPAFFQSGAADLLLERVAVERPGHKLELSPYDCIYLVGGEPDGERTVTVVFQERTSESGYGKPDSRTFDDDDLVVILEGRQHAALEQVPDETIILGCDHYDSDLSRRRIFRLIRDLQKQAEG